MLFYHYFSLFSINIHKNFQKTIAILCKLWYNASIVNFENNTCHLGERRLLMRNIFKPTITEKTCVVVEHDRLDAHYNLSKDQMQYLLSRYHPKRDCVNDANLIVRILKSSDTQCSCSTAYERTLCALAMDLKEPSLENLSKLSSLADIEIPTKEQEKFVKNWEKLFCNCKTIDSIVNRLRHIAQEYNW